MKTTRETVEEKLEEKLTEMIRNGHDTGYAEYCVDATGEIVITDVQDNTYYGAIGGYERIVIVGTGSTPCNCDWCCGDKAVDSIDDIEPESDEYDLLREKIAEKLDELEDNEFFI